ncbi:MAG TPA: proton-conducting transporter membrane subunit, partial [Vicinamibacteria bacterium]|nr:proton-conducting transporter membrane subunit [Vicinamibacteria bacterium]
IPWTFWTFLVGCLAIAGIWPFAGFYSKDEILLGAWNEHRPVLFAVAFLTASLTAFYMFRLLFMTFFGKFRGSHEAEHHVHESPWTMLLPLLLLAVGSASVGFLVHVPHIVEPVFRLGEVREEHVGWLPWAATANAVLAILLAVWMYVWRTDLPGKVATSFAPLVRVFENKYGFDLAYDAFARNVVVKGSERVLWKFFDAGIIDGLVNGAGNVTAAIGEWVRLFESGLVRAYTLAILGGAVALLGYLLRS